MKDSIQTIVQNLRLSGLREDWCLEIERQAIPIVNLEDRPPDSPWGSMAPHQPEDERSEYGPGSPCPNGCSGEELEVITNPDRPSYPKVSLKCPKCALIVFGKDRYVVCAAMEHHLTGQIVLGIRHYCPTMRRNMENMGGVSFWRTQSTQGFVDSFGTFLSREVAWDLARAQGQIRHACGPVGGGELYSEHLY